MCRDSINDSKSNGNTVLRVSFISQVMPLFGIRDLHTPDLGFTFTVNVRAFHNNH